METQLDTSVRFGEFELNLLTRELYRDGSRLKIRGHPIDVLAILLEHPGELVTREMLQKRLWPENTFVDFEQILNNSVGKLRDALGDRAEAPRFIETLPRLGYRFIAAIERPAATTDQAAQASPPQKQQPLSHFVAPARPHPISKRRILWRALAVAVVFASFAYWYLRRPLPVPRISRYEQLTLDGRMKIPRGTDGTRVFMNTPEARVGIAEVPVTGGKVTDFPIDLPGGSQTPTYVANVSPDGSRLLVTNHFEMGKGFMVWVVGNLGHPARFLLRGGATGWSPDGRTIVYTTPHGDIFTIDAEGGEPHLLHRDEAPANQTMPSSFINWSPDGSTIRLTRMAGKIFEISSKGENFHEWLPGWNGGIQKCCGRWTPDGQFYLFTAERTFTKVPGLRPVAEIWAVDERHSRIRPRIAEPILLASLPLVWGNPIPSRDGKKIFARGVSLRGELERYDISSRGLKPYLDGISAEMVDFSRDGKYVAYVTFPEGVLWRANRDGRGLVQLTQPPLYPRNPRWSPDGTQLLFTANAQTGVDAIYVISSQGGAPSRLFPDTKGAQSLADWSPDGSKVVYCTDEWFSVVPRNRDKNETRIVELATRKVTVLPQRPGGFWAPLWSPDGRYIAGHSSDGTELLTFDLKTAWRVVDSRAAIDFHNWSHDGRFLYFIRQIQDKIGVYRVPIPVGKPELVFALPDGFHGTGWYEFWMSLDPTDAPLFIRNAGTDEIYALTLEVK